MHEICNGVRVEPELLPLNNEQTVNGNVAQRARLDVSGNGVWGPQERTFLDIRIMHPNAPSYREKDIKQVYRQHEQEKKRTYNERIIQVEKGSFTPIVMSTVNRGNFGPGGNFGHFWKFHLLPFYLGLGG